jgi:hypothetical protein
MSTWCYDGIECCGCCYRVWSVYRHRWYCCIVVSHTADLLYTLHKIDHLISTYSIHFYSYFTCPQLDKVGGLGDGPKWTCDINRIANQVARRKEANPTATHKQCLIYSIGSNGDYQWEDAVQEILHGACEIHIFDPGNFDRGVNNTAKGMIYHPWGLTSSYDQSVNAAINKGKKRKSMVTHSFPEIQKLLGHEGRTVDIFKIDCEGCEWYVVVAVLVIMN